MLVPIAQMAKGIFRLGPFDTGHASAATAPFLVVGKDKAAVIEPGEDGLVPGTLEGIKAIEVDVNRIAYVLGTHIHMHHIQGASLLLKSLPNAKFVGHPRGVPHVIEPSRLIQSTIAAWGEKCYGKFDPIPAERTMAVDDGQVLDLGGRQLEIIYTPGHAPHHICIFDTLTRGMFSGDIISLSIPGKDRGHCDILPPLFDVAKSIESIRRVRAYKPTMLLSHRSGGACFEPEDTLRWAEEDILAIERICRTGMQAGISYKEINRRVQDYQMAVGDRVTDPVEQEAFTSGSIFGMLNYLHREDPNLPMPADASQRLRRA